MSVSLTFDTGDELPLASNTGWGDFCRWADALGDRYPQLAHLRQHGWSQDLGALEDELDEAAEESAPADDVQSVLDALADALEARGDAEAAAVSDGLGPDTDGDDDEEDQA